MPASVSVIIPAYNAERHIAGAIESCLAQTFPPNEILVIDDGSVDRTSEIASAFGGKVRAIRKPNGGPASARNLGTRMASGEWLALLDADDWWLPTKLEAQLACDTFPGIGLIHCLADHRPEHLPACLTFDDLWRRNRIINSSVLIRHRAFEELGGFDEAPELISVEDYNFWLRLSASSWKIVTCNEVLVHYTRGIGISSNLSRFMTASLYNVDALEQALHLAPGIAQKKRIRIWREFGGSALHERQMDLARSLLWRAFSAEPSVNSAIHLAKAVVPTAVLNLKRHAGRQRGAEAKGATQAQNDEAASIPDTRSHSLADISRLAAPILVTTIDAEEAFDWSQPFSRAATDVSSMRSQQIAHRLFERYGVIPVYLVDFPVASQDSGRGPLRELVCAGACDIGAQLHPWVTPPFRETVSNVNSYPGNLPAELEEEKLAALTGEIEAALGITPRIYRAGRYGAGGHTAGILRTLGYEADTSVMPGWNFAREGGPDYRLLKPAPFWLDKQRSLLELPISAATVGRASQLRLPASNLFDDPESWSYLRSALARLNLLERIKLTPEGIGIEEAKRLVRHMARGGYRVFVMTYHSPSLEPGNTPYVRTARDLERLLAWLDEFYDFFQTEMKGRFVDWRTARDLLSP